MNGFQSNGFQSDGFQSDGFEWSTIYANSVRARGNEDPGLGSAAGPNLRITTSDSRAVSVAEPLPGPRA